jgi:hypothetical protein
VDLDFEKIVKSRVNIMQSAKSLSAQEIKPWVIDRGCMERGTSGKELCNTLFPPDCKYNWTGQGLWKTHKYEYVM